MSSDPKPNRAASARILDFAVGGKDNYSADREVAIETFQSLPATRLLPRENRKFMRRAVRFLLEAGIRQFIDVGCGLPGKADLHEVVLGADPDARVVYVDNDPVSVVHFQSLVHAVPGAAAILADAREPRSILEHEGLTGLIDFGKPVAVLMISVLDLLLDEEDPEATVAAFTSAMAPGSHLVVCDFTDENLTAEERATADHLIREYGVVVTFRSRERLTGFFDGLGLLEPGLVNAAEWRPDREGEPPSGWLLAGIGRKP
ncbi:SAM-dependent methyltransferase [Actinomadura barringtoniae]|uniref:SAM-dependent methyltransferase n=1 Tax=Actinomadura barringtoniae TaxID=1427535 RepID=A0A939T9T8_9ACTN|nr:SAM-dependent methyltransferase [Actinomadura barringtoniae]MBO2455468.1 SAM-dependent methyltransferase [Actinomadura barringtoniae]